ncbi:sialidase family protein [Negadavirga shengliensis]
MKYRLIKSLLVVIGSLMFLACGEKRTWPEKESIQFEQVVVPLIQGRESPIGHIRMDLESGDELKEIRIKAEGDAIEGITVALLSQDGKEKKGLGETRQGEVFWTVALDRQLESGAHLFEIGLMVKETASLTEKVSFEVVYVEMSSGKFRPSGQEYQQSYRLAKALRHHGDDGVHSFRIPGLVTSNNGTLLAVYDVRRDDSSDLQGDIDVGLSRSTDGGESWEPMKMIMDMGEWGGLPENQNGIGDPAILVDEETGTIWVAALWLHGKPGTMAWNSSGEGMSPEETGQLMLVKSEDDGVTWSDPINVTGQMKDPSWRLFFNGPGRGITMRDGTLVFAAQFKDKENIPHSTVIYSKDRGETWEVGTGARSKTTEAQVVELQDGSLLLNMRDDRGGARAVMVTKDMGKTWEEHPTNRAALIEPVCMASIISNPHTDDPVLFFSNPAATDGRYNITIKASLDDGQSWPEAHQVLLDQKRGWGYSCLTMIDEDHLGILYESSQAHMTFQIIRVDEIIK